MPLFITIAQVPELLEHMIRISTAMFADVSTWAKATRVAGEREYGCNDLMVGLAACRLDSGAQYAEWMASQGDTVGLDDLLASRDFARCLTTSGAGKLLRFDRRLVLWALRWRAYPIIASIAMARAAKARR